MKNVVDELKSGALVAGMQNKNPEAILTASEVAAILRCSKSAVYTLAKTGQLQALRIGGMIRFRRCDLEELLQPARTTSGD